MFTVLYTIFIDNLNSAILVTTVVVIVLCIGRTELGYAVPDQKIVAIKWRRTSKPGEKALKKVFNVCLIVVQGEISCLEAPW